MRIKFLLKLWLFQYLNLVIFNNIFSTCFVKLTNADLWDFGNVYTHLRLWECKKLLRLWKCLNSKMSHAHFNIIFIPNNCILFEIIWLYWFLQSSYPFPRPPVIERYNSLICTTQCLYVHCATHQKYKIINQLWNKTNSN
jgi:hypothetical protein